MDYSQHNVELLKGRSHLIIPPEDDAVFRADIVPSNVEGMPTVSVQMADRAIFIHSKFDPLKDARRWAEKLEVKSPVGVALVFGFGFGYHIEALLEAHPQIRKAIVFDVSPDVVRLALAARPLDALINDPRVNIFAGPCSQIFETLKAFIDQYMGAAKNSSADIFIHPASLEAFPEDSADLREALEHLRLRSRSAGVFSKEKEENTAANAEAFAASPGVSSLFKTRRGRAMIVAASGPSLDMSLPLLNDDRFEIPEIICVDSALAPFRAAGVAPDFVLSGDPQTHTIRLFEGLDRYDETLIFFASSNPQVVGLYPPEKRLAACSSISESEVALDAETKKGLLHFSGTVLLAALDFAVKSGASPVVIIGADFSFADEQTHATGSRTQGIASRYGRLREVQGIDGQPVKTSDVFYAFMKELEEYYMKYRGDTTIYNATARGAAVLHVPHVSLESFLTAYTRTIRSL